MPTNESEFDALVGFLAPLFPSLPVAIAEMSSNGAQNIVHPDDETLSVRLLRDGPRLRLTLDSAQHVDATLRYKELEEDAFRKEAETHKTICQNAPQLIWQENNEGQVVWANATYLRYADLHVRADENIGQAWPKKRLFSDAPFPIAHDALPLTKRRSLQLHGEEAEHWFNVTSMPTANGALHYAIDANEIMRAEESQKAFVTTISNTFAQLSIGLAVFDRKRRLASYNPAFGDLTGLPASFLVGRPSIEIVLDQLREMRKLPEPKDYSSFREQFSALETAAQQGTYVENWDMPDGQTYRVTGKPHPGGALAFLFEDITAEISLTRRFRSEIETSQAVIDSMPDAIAVFSASQSLVISNVAYSEMWADDVTPDSIAYDLRIALRQWKSGCVSSAVWRRIESFAGSLSEREAWSETVVLKDGRQVACSVTPLKGSMTMVKFTPRTTRSLTLEKLTAPDFALQQRKV
ncbi:PAS-domain containing protein [Cognatiyoonia koreensis]|nr:PAS-domain containing protein [Cognatiyoonia koreensis]